MMMCQCGCGRPAPIAKCSHASKGWVKGQPLRYIRGHIGGINAAREYQKKLRTLDDGTVVKWCTSCKQFKPVALFDKSQYRQDRLRSHCRECHNYQEKARYIRDPGPVKRRSKLSRRRSQKRVRARIVEIRSAGCLACPERDPCCVEFHHIAGKKDKAVTQCTSIPELERELAKCAQLCANCHKKAHAGRLTITPSMMYSAPKEMAA